MGVAATLASKSRRDSAAGVSPSGRHYLRLVFANEPAERLAGLGDRFRRALG